MGSVVGTVTLVLGRYLVFGYLDPQGYRLWIHCLDPPRALGRTSVGCFSFHPAIDLCAEDEAATLHREANRQLPVLHSLWIPQQNPSIHSHMHIWYTYTYIYIYAMSTVLHMYIDV